MNTFWEIVASNAMVATVLAIGALLLRRVWKNAAAVHVLWIAVLLKLFTPPLVTAELPSAFLPSGAGADTHARTPELPTNDRAKHGVPASLADTRVPLDVGVPQRTTWNRFSESAVRTPWSFSALLAALWIGGACCTAAGSVVRILRFTNVIGDCEEAQPALRAMVAGLSMRLGLKRVPDVLMTSHALPPLVWSFGLSPRLILPSELFARLSGEAQATILAHELCHIRRGDDLVRLLELAATTVFWWHPVVRLASRQLRELEDECCDSRALELVSHQPRTYAVALVDTMEFLSERPRTPVPLRTAIYSTGSLSRRIRMLSHGRANRLSSSSGVLVAGLVAFPLAVAFAGDQEQATKTPKGQPSAEAAILRGRVTDEAGTPLGEVRVRVAIPAADMRFVDVSTPHKQVEAISDAEGNYRMEIPGIEKREMVSIDAMKPGYRRLVGTLMAGGDEKSVEVAPGKPTDVPLRLKSALYFAGVVVNEQGKPIPGVQIAANSDSSRASGGVERTASNFAGSFELFNYPDAPRLIQNEVSKGAVSFAHQDYIESEIEDVYAIDDGERGALQIVLATGHRVAGTVLDVAGKPVPRAMVKAISKDGHHRKATTTDAEGKFALRGLKAGPTSFSARALDINQKLNLPMAIEGDKNDLEVRLQPMSLPADLKTHAVLGMQLADVTPELKSAYDLFFDKGALILDPGKDSERLAIGQLAEGYSFFMVGNKRIGSVREFVSQILAETAGRRDDQFSVRVVYTYSTPEFDGTNTQYMKLTNDDVKELQALSGQFAPMPQ